MFAFKIFYPYRIIIVFAIFNIKMKLQVLLALLGLNSAEKKITLDGPIPWGDLPEGFAGPVTGDT
jgi:hypothetical protein